MNEVLRMLPPDRLAQLEEREKYLTLLMKNSPDIVLFLDQNGSISHCTEAFLTLMGIRDFKQVKGRVLLDVYQTLQDEEFIELTRQQLNAVKETLSPFSFDTHIAFPSLEERRPYSVRSIPLLDTNGEFFGSLLIYNDTTKLRDEESNDRTQIMLDATPLAASFWDETGAMLDCNMEAVRLFGLTKKSDYLEHFFDLNPEFQPDGESTLIKAERLIKAAFETGYQRFEWMYLRPDGSELPVETTLVRVPWKDEFRLAAYSRDLREIRASEQKRKEAEQHSLNMEVQARAALAASAAKSQFLSNMSHEIRTPMNAILGMAELLQSENLNERQRSYVSDILISAKSLLGIINDILDFSKIEAGKLKLSPVDYDIRLLLENIHSMFSFAAKEKGISFDTNVSADLPRYLYGDDIRLRQILVNILGNAIQFTDHGGIAFTARSDADSISFEIADTGTGIRKEDLPRIYDNFAQLDMNNNRNSSGTGLGLPITQKLVDMMGGRIRVESEFGAGTTFFIWIPLVPGNEDSLLEEKESPEIVSAPKANVLVVDDNELNLHVASGVLHQFDIDCDTAGSGKEAIQMVLKKHYDLIFMDHMMPGLDGVETTKILRGHTGGRQLIIIALTANAVAGVRETLLASDMDDYLTKPIDRKKLNGVLAKWLPPEKVSVKSENLTEEPVTLSPLLTRIREIDGLDIFLGLARVGEQQEAYEQSLRILVRRLPEIVERLIAFLEKEDLKGFSIEVHGLKGSMNNIGATLLGRSAEELEHHAKDGDLIFCRHHLPELLSPLEEMSGHLQSALTKEDGQTEQRTGDLAQLSHRIPELRAQIESFESDEALELLTSLTKYTYGSKGDTFLQKLLRNLEEFQYDEALSLIDEITDLW